jgi:hypothetical protein
MVDETAIKAKKIRNPGHKVRQVKQVKQPTPPVPQQVNSSSQTQTATVQIPMQQPVFQPQIPTFQPGMQTTTIPQPASTIPNLESQLNEISDTPISREAEIIKAIIENRIDIDLFLEEVRIQHPEVGQETVFKRVSGGKKDDLQISRVIKTHQGKALRKEILVPIARVRGDDNHTTVVQDSYYFFNMINNAQRSGLAQDTVLAAMNRFDIKDHRYGLHKHKTDDQSTLNDARDIVNARKELIEGDALVLKKSFLSKLPLVKRFSSNTFYQVYSRKGAKAFKEEYIFKKYGKIEDPTQKKLAKQEANQYLQSLSQRAYLTFPEKHDTLMRTAPWLLALLVGGAKAKDIGETLDEVSGGLLSDVQDHLEDILGWDDNDPNPVDPIDPDTNEAPDLNLPNDIGEGKQNEPYVSNSFKVTDRDGDQVNVTLENMFNETRHGNFNLVPEGNGMYHIEGTPKTNGSLGFKINVDDGQEYIHKDIDIPFAPEDIIVDPNEAPVEKAGAQKYYNGTTGRSFEVNLNIWDDPNNDTLTTRLESDNPFVTINGNKVNATMAGEYILKSITTDGEFERETNIFVNITDPGSSNTAPYFLLPDSINMTDDVSYDFDLFDIVGDEQDLPKDMNLTVRSLTPGVSAVYQNNTVKILAEEGFEGLAKLAWNLKDSGNLSTEHEMDVHVTHVYQPAQIHGFNLTQDAEDGNFYDVDLFMESFEGDFDRVEIKSGEELIKNYVINDKVVDIYDRLDFSDRTPGDLPINITAFSKDNVNVTVINDYVNVQNDIDLEAVVVDGDGDHPKIEGTAFGMDDNITRVEIEAEEDGEIFDNTTIYSNSSEQEFSYTLNRTGEKGQWNWTTTAYDENGAVAEVRGSSNTADRPADIDYLGSNTSMGNTSISFTVNDTDSIVTEAEADIDGVGVVAGEAVDGELNENLEEVIVKVKTSELPRGEDVDVDLSSSGGSASVSVYIPDYVSLEDVDTELGYQSLNVSARLKADNVYQSYNVTGVTLQVNDGDLEDILITEGNTATAEVTLDATKLPRGTNSDLRLRAIDNVDADDPAQHDFQVYVPALPAIGAESIDQTDDWCNISVPLDGDGLAFKEFLYQIDNGEWQQGELDGNTGKLNLNATDMIGTYNIDVKAINEWDDEVTHNFEIEIDAEEKIYQVIFKHRLYEGGNEDNHRTLVNDLTGNLGDVTLPDYYSGLDTIVNGLKLNKTETNTLLRHLSLGHLNASEVAAATTLFNERPDLRQNVALFQTFLEWKSIQDRVINGTDDQNIDYVKDGFDSGDSTEKLMWNLRSVLSEDNRYAEITEWYITNHAKAEGLNLANKDIAKLGISIGTVFNAFKTTNNWYQGYIPEFLAFLETQYGSLENIAKSGAAVPSLLTPYISISTNKTMPQPYSATDLGDVVMPVSDLKNVTSLLKDWGYHNAVNGKSLHNASSDWQARVEELDDDSKDIDSQRIMTWPDMYHIITNIGEHDVDCNILSAIADLGKFMGYWNAPNGTAIANYENGHIARTGGRANVPNHVGYYDIFKDDGTWIHWGDRALDIINEARHGEDSQRYRVAISTTSKFLLEGPDGKAQINHDDVSHETNFGTTTCEAVDVPHKKVDLANIARHMNNYAEGAEDYYSRSTLNNRHKVHT